MIIASVVSSLIAGANPTAGEAPVYTITVEGVREVCLIAAADAEPVTARLQPEGVTPALEGGKAQVMICAMESRFMGLRFRESVVSVAIERAGEPGAQDFFLVQAFNSRKGFARVERERNASPYLHADVRVLPSAEGASFSVVVGGQSVYAAAMSARPDPGPPMLEEWQGAILLPGLEGAPGGRFDAFLRGGTHIHPATPQDSLSLCGEGLELCGWLSSLHLSPIEWWVRTDATHSKGETVRR